MIITSPSMPMIGLPSHAVPMGAPGLLMMDEGFVFPMGHGRLSGISSVRLSLSQARVLSAILPCQKRHAHPALQRRNPCLKQRRPINPRLISIEGHDPRSGCGGKLLYYHTLSGRVRRLSDFGVLTEGGDGALNWECYNRSQTWRAVRLSQTNLLSLKRRINSKDEQFILVRGR
jgi:hypothetical protein